MNKITKWSAVIIISGTVGFGFWAITGLFQQSDVVQMPDDINLGDSTYVGERKYEEIQINPGESFSISINLVKESHPYAGFAYTDTVNTDCITRTFQTGEYLSMQVTNPYEEIIVDVDAKVNDPFFVCALSLKEGIRDLYVGTMVTFKAETKGVYTMTITNPQNVPVDVSYDLTDEAGSMPRPTLSNK